MPQFPSTWQGPNPDLESNMKPVTVDYSDILKDPKYTSLAVEDRPSCKGKGGSRGSEISLKVASKICKMALASNREARVVAGPK